MSLLGYTYHDSLTDSNSTALSNFVVRVDLTSANFDFASAKADGSDLRVRDETAGALVPIYLFAYDPVGRTGTLYYKATATGNSHRLYYGNPSAAAVSSFSAVFTNGTGFDTDFGDLSTAVAGTGLATRVAGSTGASDPRNFQVWRIAENPILSLSDLTTAGVPAGNYTGLREFSPVRDSSNKVIPVGGKYYAFFARRPSTTTDHIDTWRGESTSGPYGPFSNFTQVYTPPSGIRLGYVGSVLKIGSTYYLYLTYGWSDGAGGATPGLSIYYMTSADCLTWSAVAQCVLPASYKDSAGNACSDIGNPWVIPLADGTYMMTFEAQLTGTTLWSCNGATSPDGRTWTPINSGTPLITKGAAGTWDSTWAANPKCMQLADGSILVQYNGAENAGNNDQQLGFATSPIPAGAYTKASYNPVSGRPYGAYGHEAAALCWDADGVTPLNVVQRFSTTSATGSFYRCYQDANRGGLLVSRDDPTTGVSADGAVMGKVVAAGTFTAETRSAFTAHRASGATPILLGLYNSATLPTPAANAGFATKRVVEVIRWSHDTAAGTTAGPGDVTIKYYAVSTDTVNYWNGSAWTTSTTGRNIAADHAREVVTSVSDDGTNYVIKVTYADDGSTIASASIAKSSCQPWTNRLVWAGDPFTDVWECGLFFRYFQVRPYAATQPAMSLSAPVQDFATWYSFTAPSPASGAAGATSRPFTVTPNGPYNGTVTIAPSGGGLSAPIVLTFTSAAPQQFTIAPPSGGTVTLTPTNSGGLPDATALTYVSNPVSSAPTTWPMMAMTTSFAPSRAGSLGWTLYTPAGAIVTARTTSGITAIGNAFVATVPVPWAGAFVLDWDDGVTHDAQAVEESYIEMGVTWTQALSVMYAVLSGLTGGGGTQFLAPDNSTVRLQGTVSGGDRTGSIPHPVN